MSGYVAAQHIDAEGRYAWGDAGVRLTNQPDQIESADFVYSVAADGTGGAVAVWNYHDDEDTISGYVYYAQRIDSSGNALWSDGGMRVGSLGYSDGWRLVVRDGTTYIPVAHVGDHYCQEPHIQKITADGALPWGPEGLQFGEE
jgi:hypothetical protein